MAETGAARTIASAGGAVAIVTSPDQKAYEDYHFAAARRAGDCVYISGVIIARPDGAPTDVTMFQAQTRLAFEKIGARLGALGARFADVVMINSFHVWNGPDFPGDRMAQFMAFVTVKDEFMPAPYAAWTAVGTSGLLGKNGIVEVQMIAFAPLPPEGFSCSMGD